MVDWQWIRDTVDRLHVLDPDQVPKGHVHNPRATRKTNSHKLIDFALMAAYYLERRRETASR